MLIDITSMTDFEGKYDEFIILNIDNNTIGTNTIAPLSSSIGNQGLTLSSWIICDTIEISLNLFSAKRIQLFKTFGKFRGWYHLIGHPNLAPPHRFQDSLHILLMPNRLL